MKNPVQVKCLNNGITKVVDKGTTLFQIVKEFNITLKNPILGALVNNTFKDLSFEIFHPKSVLFIDITHPEGMRIYIRSLSFVLYKAVDELFPESQLRICHSISKGIYCEILNMDHTLSENDIEAVKQRMKKIIDDDLPFIHKEGLTEEVFTEFEEHRLLDKKNLLKSWGRNYISYYKMNDHCNTFYGCLVPSTKYLKVFDLVKYFDGMLLRVPKKSDPSVVEEIIVQNNLFEIFNENAQWSKILEVPGVSDLNDACSNGKSERLIKIAEALHEKKIAQIADNITSRKDKPVKVVLISGPSSSGKTTFAKRLAVQLMVNGKKPVNISIDNYFVNRDKTPLDENGEYDFESIESLDLELFNNNLLDLLNYRKIELPKFSFEKGERYYDGETIECTPDNLLIIEGIHALNPRLTTLVPDDLKYKIYVSALTSLNLDNQNRISTTDNRLVRRIVRDYQYRHYSAKETISRWPSVGKGEELHIFPFQEKADIMFNSALIYELAVLKYLVEPMLQEINPNEQEFAEASRLLQFLSYIKPLRSNEIPPTSILREFLGGSSFSY
jgi:uridine kinase